MKMEVHRDGRVTLDGVLIARTNNPQEVLKRLQTKKIDGLVLNGTGPLVMVHFSRFTPFRAAFPSVTFSPQNA